MLATMPTSVKPRRIHMIGLALLATAVVGLAISVLDGLAVAECRRDSEGLMILCAGPLPPYLFWLWLVAGAVGSVLLWQGLRTRIDPVGRS
jgi:hypothetical protein